MGAPSYSLQEDEDDGESFHFEDGGFGDSSREVNGIFNIQAELLGSSLGEDFLEFVQDADVSKAVAFTEGTYNPVSQMGSEDVMSKFDAEELDAIQMDSLEEEMARSLDYQVVSSYDALIDIYTQERRS